MKKLSLFYLTLCSVLVLAVIYFFFPSVKVYIFGILCLALIYLLHEIFRREMKISLEGMVDYIKKQPVNNWSDYECLEDKVNKYLEGEKSKLIKLLNKKRARIVFLEKIYLRENIDPMFGHNSFMLSLEAEEEVHTLKGQIFAQNDLFEFHKELIREGLEEKENEIASLLIMNQVYRVLEMKK